MLLHAGTHMPCTPGENLARAVHAVMGGSLAAVAQYGEAKRGGDEDHQGSVPGGAAPLASVMSHDALYVCAASWYRHLTTSLLPVRIASNQPSN